MGIDIKWFTLVWLMSMTLTVESQCSTHSETFNSPTGGPYFSSEEIVPQDMLEDMIGFLKLVRSEWWFETAHNFTVTRTGDSSCAFLGEGVSMDTLENFDPSWSVPLLTDLVIVGDNVFIPGKISTFATLDQFAELATILCLKSQVELGKHHRIVVNLVTRTLHNFDSSVPNSCMMIGLTGNLKHHMEVMMISLGVIWDRFLPVMIAFGQENYLEGLKQCCGSRNLTFPTLVYLADPLFTLCTRPLLSRNLTKDSKRTIRSVSLLSELFGDGAEILRLEGTLSEAISRFNTNFRKEEKFDHQVQQSLVDLSSEMNHIMENEEKLKHKLLQLHIELRQY